MNVSKWIFHKFYAFGQLAMAQKWNIRYPYKPHDGKD